MNTKEAYKIGFMLKCAELGLDPEKAATDFILIKSGAGGLLSLLGGGLGKLFGTGKEVAGGIINKGLGWGIPLALLAPPAAGVVGGYALHNVMNPEIDYSQIQKEEEVEEYERAISRLKKNLRRRGVKV